MSEVLDKAILLHPTKHEPYKFYLHESVPSDANTKLRPRITAHGGIIVTTDVEADVVIVKKGNEPIWKNIYGCHPNPEKSRLEVESLAWVESCISTRMLYHPSPVVIRMGGQGPALPTRAFTPEDDMNLALFIGYRHPLKGVRGRVGLTTYDKLVELGKDPAFTWANRHTSEGWRGRYRRKQEWFDNLIQELVEAGTIVPNSKDPEMKNFKSFSSIINAMGESKSEGSKNSSTPVSSQLLAPSTRPILQETMNEGASGLIPSSHIPTSSIDRTALFRHPTKSGEPYKFYIHESFSNRIIKTYGCIVIANGGSIVTADVDADVVIVKAKDKLALTDIYRGHPMPEKSKLMVEDIAWIDRCLSTRRLEHRPAESRRFVKPVYTTEDDRNLALFIGQRHPFREEGRRSAPSNYHQLVQMGGDPAFAWVGGHTSEAWKSRYWHNQEYFDNLIQELVEAGKINPNSQTRNLPDAVSKAISSHPTNGQSYKLYFHENVSKSTIKGWWPRIRATGSFIVIDDAEADIVIARHTDKQTAMNYYSYHPDPVKNKLKVESLAWLWRCINPGTSDHMQTHDGQLTTRSFTKEDDMNLALFLGHKCPFKEDGGRVGSSLYEQLVEMAVDPAFTWALRHPSAGWRHRYRYKQKYFDDMIQELVEAGKINTNSQARDPRTLNTRPVKVELLAEDEPKGEPFHLEEQERNMMHPSSAEAQQQQLDEDQSSNTLPKPVLNCPSTATASTTTLNTAQKRSPGLLSAGTVDNNTSGLTGRARMHSYARSSSKPSRLAVDAGTSSRYPDLVSRHIVALSSPILALCSWRHRPIAKNSAFIPPHAHPICDTGLRSGTSAPTSWVLSRRRRDRLFMSNMKGIRMKHLSTWTSSFRPRTSLPSHSSSSLRSPNLLISCCFLLFTDLALNNRV